MTYATVEQQGESERRREHPEAPQAADSSRSSSSESSTDTEMGLVDVCTILCGNSERATGTPVAAAEGREGGPVTLDLTNGEFNKTECRTRCRKLIENSKPLLLMGSPIDSDGEAISKLGRFCTWHSFVNYTKYKCATVFSSLTFALRQELGPAISCGLHEQVPRHVPDSD